MIIIKPLIFIFANILVGFLFIFTLKAFLFFPRKEKRVHGRKIPLTPGFIHKKKKWLIDKLHSILHKYLADAKSEREGTRISQWELKVFKAVYDKLKPISEFKFLPRKIKENIRHFLSTMVYEIVKQFLRSFVPYLMDRYNLKQYIDLLNVKLNVKVIEEYFNKYVYRFLLIFTLAFCFLIGLGNMIIYLIIR